MSRASRRALLAGAVLLAAAAPACFDAPVRQGLEIFFNGDASVEVHASTVIPDDWLDTDQPKVRARLDAVRDAILHGEDLWSRAFRAMEPRRERVVFDYEEGLLSGSTRLAMADDPAAVERLFTGTPVGAFVQREEAVMTLELVPSGANDATQRQERKVAEALETFSRAVAAHLEALADLYEWLDAHPDSERWAMSKLLGMDEGSGQEGDDEGRALLEAADDSDDAMLKVLEIPGTEAYTLDELSRLVHDPFPSPVTIEVDGEVLESAGFRRNGERRFHTRSHSLWDALFALQGRWVEPVPIVEAVSAFRAVPPGEELDEEALLDRVLISRRVAHQVPSAAQVKEAIVEALTPPDLYRLRWRLPPGD